MNWTLFVFIFLVVWWIVLLAVLPFGSNPVNKPEKGHDHGAPARPRLLIKFFITTVIAILISSGIIGLINSDVIDFHNQHLSEDKQ